MSRIVASRVTNSDTSPAAASSCQTLMQHDLVDEYRLMVPPVVLGSGKRLFRDGGNTTALSVVDTKPAGAVVILTLRPAGDETGDR